MAAISATPATNLVQIVDVVCTPALVLAAKVDEVSPEEAVRTTSTVGPTHSPWILLYNRGSHENNIS